MSGTNIDRRDFLKGTAAALATSVAASNAAVAEEFQEQEIPDREIPDGPEDLSTARAAGGMVTSTHPLATKAGLSILENGGNAVDAAGATQLALDVVEPHASGLGGGSQLLAYNARDNATYGINGEIRAPSSADPELFLDDDGEPRDIYWNGLAVGVPGTLRTVDISLKRWGTKYFDEVAQPAVELAANGFEVDIELARALADNNDKFTPAAQRVYCKNGEPLGVGDRLVQKDLARTHRAIRDKGVEPFYQGEIGEALAAVVQDTNGIVTPTDLARYNATVDHPIRVDYGDYQIETMPAAGGMIIPIVLRLLEGFDFGSYDTRSANRYHLLTEAIRLAFADYDAYAGDDAFVDIPLQGLFDDAYIEDRRDLIAIDEANADIEAGQPWKYQPGEPYRTRGHTEAFRDGNDIEERSPAGQEMETETTHVTVADAEGNIVAHNSTLGPFFGTGIMVPDYGIMLGATGSYFDFEPGGVNEVQPDKRAANPMSPTMIMEDNSPFLALGSPSSALVSAISQIFLDIVENDLSLPEAVAEPRVFGPSYPTLTWEEGIPVDTREQLEEKGHEIPDESTDNASVQAVLVEDDEYLGVADSRRDGLALGYSED